MTTDSGCPLDNVFNILNKNPKIIARTDIKSIIPKIHKKDEIGNESDIKIIYSEDIAEIYNECVK